MACDSYYGIGDKHQVCQDYALHGAFDDETEYVIVSDGCSSADYSEIGAQILCHAAKYQLSMLHQAGLFWECSLQTLSSMLSGSILKRINEVAFSYPINIGALEATLFIAIRVINRAYVFGWGDGVIISRYMQPNGEIYEQVIDINYPNNAPFYLVLNHPRSREAYINKRKKAGVEKPKVEHTRYSISEGEWEAKIIEYRIDRPYEEIIGIPAKEAEDTRLMSLTVSTDGICSFQDANKDSVDLIDIIPEVVEFKATEGEFVKKRMFFFKRKARKNNWTHSDDLGCGTILI